MSKLKQFAKQRIVPPGVWYFLVRIRENMNRRGAVHIITNWILPRRFGDVLSAYNPQALRYFVRHRNQLAKNKDLKNRHAGKRCFVMCNGPSILKQDISKLEGEIVISVSSGYHHPAYSRIAPLYHCVPQITYTEKMTESVVANWLTEMQDQIGHATLFMNYTEQELVKKYGLFPNNDVRFLCMGRTRYPSSANKLDLSGIIPEVITVPLMAIMVAMHLGCKEIYLLGVDHDWFMTKEYKYFYEPTALAGKVDSLNDDGSHVGGLYDIFSGGFNIWKQHRAIRILAAQAGVKIFNATAGGALDEYERAEFESLFQSYGRAVHI